jgi:hypothetical protein
MIAAAVVMLLASPFASSSFAATVQFNPGPLSQVESGAVQSAVVLGPLTVGQPTVGDPSSAAILDVGIGGVVLENPANFTYYLPNGDGTYTPETGVGAIKDAVANLSTLGNGSLSNGQLGYTNGGLPIAQTGITSSANNTGAPGTVGIVSADYEVNNQGNYTTWRGVNLATVLATNPNAYLIGYAAIGDMDLNGYVTSNDFATMNANYNLSQSTGLTGTSWIDGDEEYAGTVTSNSFAAVNANYNAQNSGTLPTYYQAAASGTPVSAPSLTASPVPEPGTLSILVVIACSSAIRFFAASLRGQR